MSLMVDVLMSSSFVRTLTSLLHRTMIAGPRSLVLLLLAMVFEKGVALASPHRNVQAEWSQRKDAAKITPKRSGHVSFTTHDGRLMVFGGYVEEEGEEHNRYVVNDLWEWKKQGWQLVPQDEEKLPCPRLVSAAAFVGKTPYMLGGWDPQTEGTGGVILDTIHKFKSKTNEWVLLDDVTLPDGPASRHVCLTLTNNKLLFHNHRCTDHIFLFDGKEFEKQTTTGTAPSSRGLHAATMLDDSHALVFAGAAQGGSMSNECFVLDLCTWKWTQLKVDEAKDAPTPRASPCLCQFSAHCAIVFGGASVGDAGLVPEGDVWALHIDVDYKNATWQLLSSDGPAPRNAATLNLIDCDEGSKEYLLAGGWAPFVETHDDCFVLKVKSIE
jgi:hypothetical protein